MILKVSGETKVVDHSPGSINVGRGTLRMRFNYLQEIANLMPVLHYLLPVWLDLRKGAGHLLVVNDCIVLG